ncbi:MAG: tetratricopeptide repeat protein, partial [Myxococcota bacterium]
LAYQQGDFSRAAQLLEMAYAESPDLIYQYNRAKALQAQGSFDEALKVLNLYAGPMSRDPEKRFEDVPAFKMELDEQIALLEQNVNKNADSEEDGGSESTTNKETAPVVPEPSSASPLLVAGWTLTGVGATSLLTGALFSTGITAGGDLSGEGIDPDVAARQRPLTIILLSAGTVATGLGIYFLLRNSSNKKKKAATALHLAPVLAPGHAGAALQFRF